MEEKKEDSERIASLNAKNGRRNSEQLESKNKPVMRRKGSSGSESAVGESQVPKRLSQLFTPPQSTELLEKDHDDNSTETTRLLSDPSAPSPSIVASEGSRVSPPPSPEITEASFGSLAFLPRLEGTQSERSDSDHASDKQSASASSRNRESPSSDESQDDKFHDRDYTSWDDTICSNRSAYFKHYYQKNLSGLSNNGRQTENNTSHNSLVSLIREKNKMPQAKSLDEKKKKKEDMSLMALVIFLFLVLVIGISLIYHFYNLHLEELSLFKRLKFHEDERILNLIDSGGQIDIQARLGTTLSPYSKAEDCTQFLQYYTKYNLDQSDHQLDHHTIRSTNQSYVAFMIKKRTRPNVFQFDDETVCLEWANEARVQIHRDDSIGLVKCYNVFWAAHSSNLDLQDCVQLEEKVDGESDVWWGIGSAKGGGYPLSSLSIDSVPLNTGDLRVNEFGKVIRRVFLSSSGALLIIPNHLTARVSVSGKEFCVAVNRSDVYDQNMSNPHMLTLNYTICSSPNISSSEAYLHKLSRTSLNRLNSSEKANIGDIIRNRIQHPIYVPCKLLNVTELTQAVVEDYAVSLAEGNITSFEGATILLTTDWQKHEGDHTFDIERFPSPTEMISKLQKLGFGIALTVSPLVSTDAEPFASGVTEGYWVSQKGTSLPALVRYGSVPAAALIDFTNLRASKWFTYRLLALNNKIKLTGFELESPDYFSIPHFHSFSQPIANSDLALQSFLRASKFNGSTPLGTDAAMTPPRPPTFVLAESGERGWKGLRSLIGQVMSLTTIGYSLIDAGIVGGLPTDDGQLVEDELFLRWLQVVAFFPTFRLSAPFEMYSKETQAIVADVFALRREFALPRFEDSIQKLLDNGTSLLSPMGLLYPDDKVAATIYDQWFLGDDLLVAPIVRKGKSTRDIYVPKGFWESQVPLNQLMVNNVKPKTRLFNGPVWVPEFNVPNGGVALFIHKELWNNGKL